MLPISLSILRIHYLQTIPVIPMTWDSFCNAFEPFWSLSLSLSLSLFAVLMDLVQKALPPPL